MPSIPIRYRLRALAGAAIRRRMRAAREQFLHAARADCRGLQQSILQDLLRLNHGSACSQDHGLHPGLTIEEFRQRVPVDGYECIRPYVDRVAAGEHTALLGPSNKLLMFATTSGTTAASKLIPVTNRFLTDYRRGWQIWGIGTYSDHTLLQKLNIVQIASSHRKSFSSGGTPCGNISGLVAAMQSPIVRSLYTIPPAVAEVADAELKRFTVARLAIADPWVGAIITANPSSLVQLAELIQSHSEDLIRAIHDGGCQRLAGSRASALAGSRSLKSDPRRARQLEQLRSVHGVLRLRDCWPWLRLLGVWCGGSASAYIPRLRTLFPDVAIRDHGLHASEGRMTLPLEDGSTAGVLEVQTHYFEFLPVTEAESAHPVVLEAHELLEGTEYFILLTTSSGLWRYNIYDVVRCVGWHGSTPLLEFRHKGAHMSSITGEKLSESQVVESVQAVCFRLQIPLRLFTLTPVWGKPPGYSLFVLHEDDSTTSPPLSLPFETALHFPFSPASGEKVADRPDEGAVEEGRLQTKPPHPDPLPRIVCDEPALSSEAAIPQTIRGRGNTTGPHTSERPAFDCHNEFATALDLELSRRNEEYRDKRSSQRLAPVRVVSMDAATWKRFTAARLARSGGSAEQYKHPCLLPDPEFQSLFLKLCGVVPG